MSHPPVGSVTHDFAVCRLWFVVRGLSSPVANADTTFNTKDNAADNV